MLPNLIIIGAMKCGTTSLHSYLSLHPEIQMSSVKELDFFNEKYNWKKGIQWYESNFSERPGVMVYGEASPNYTNYTISPEVSQRMHSIVPKAKLIYLVRDPIDRMVAHYIHKCSHGGENRSIDEALSDIHGKSYLHRSLYFAQLERFLKYYPASQILVVASGDLRSKRLETMRQIFTFLGVDADFYSQIYNLERHKSRGKRRKTELGRKISKTLLGRALERTSHNVVVATLETLFYFPFSEPIPKPAVSSQVEDLLRGHLKPDVDKLRQFTGQGFKSWSA
jgi:hypothetical protein